MKKPHEVVLRRTLVQEITVYVYVDEAEDPKAVALNAIKGYPRQLHWGTVELGEAQAISADSCVRPSHGAVDMSLWTAR